MRAVGLLCLLAALNGVCRAVTVDGLESPVDEYDPADIRFSRAMSTSPDPGNEFSQIIITSDQTDFFFRSDTFAPTNYATGAGGFLEEVFLCIQDLNNPFPPAPFTASAVGCNADPSFDLHYLLQFDTQNGETRFYNCTDTAFSVSSCAAIGSVFEQFAPLTIVDGVYLTDSLITEMGFPLSLLGITDPANSFHEFVMAVEFQEMSPTTSNDDGTGFFNVTIGVDPSASEDPHVTDMNGNLYDFNGEMEHMYNIIADCDITVNAKMIDAQHPHFPEATFFGEFGIVVNGHTIDIKVRENAVVDGKLTGKDHIELGEGYHFYARFGGSRSFRIDTPTISVHITRPKWRWLDIEIEARENKPLSGVLGFHPSDILAQEESAREQYLRQKHEVSSILEVVEPAFC